MRGRWSPRAPRWSSATSSTTKGKALADEIGDAARYVHLDVTQADEWDAAVATAVNEFGKLNVLVNNAGIVALGQIGKFDMAKWQKVIDVNLTGTFLGMQASVEAMKAAGGGSIINVSSIEGLRGAVMVHPYVASKWAVRGLTKSAALELGPYNIRVNSVHPGFIRTPMTKHFPDNMLTHPAWAGPASPTRWRRSSSSSPATNRVTPPVRSSSWTAAWSTTFRTRSDRIARSSVDCLTQIVGGARLQPCTRSTKPPSRWCAACSRTPRTACG